MSKSEINNITAVILAAGQGTRMKSSRPKVLHEILGRPMIAYLLDTLRELGLTISWWWWVTRPRRCKRP